MWIVSCDGDLINLDSVQKIWLAKDNNQYRLQVVYKEPVDGNYNWENVTPVMTKAHARQVRGELIERLTNGEKVVLLYPIVLDVAEKKAGKGAE